jgi:hypothetical protein
MRKRLIYIRNSVWDAIEAHRSETGSEREDSEVLEELVLKGHESCRSHTISEEADHRERLKRIEEKFDVFSLATIQTFGILKAIHKGEEIAVEGARTARANLKETYEEIENGSKKSKAKK